MGIVTLRLSLDRIVASPWPGFPRPRKPGSRRLPLTDRPPVLDRGDGGIGEEQRPEPVLAGGRQRLPASARDEGLDLVAIGLGVARHEEVEQRLAPIAASSAISTVVARRFSAADQALGAVHLDALVIAIGGAARVGDLRDLAGARSSG